MFQSFKSILFLSILAFIIIVSGGVGFIFGQGQGESSGPGILNVATLFQSEKIERSLIDDVWNLIHQDYVGSAKINDEDLVIGAIRGMMASLDDPYSVFFDETETDQFLESVNGKFEGVGIEIAIRDDRLTVVSPIKNSPAFRAGAQAGDKIIAIDGESTEGITIEEAVATIRGPKGTLVVLTVFRGDEAEEVDLNITRDVIEVPSIEFEILENNIAYIELSSFNETTLREFSIAAGSILNSNADRIILDLRNNPGGFLNVSVNLAGWFLPYDTVVVKEALNDGSEKVHKTTGPASLKDFPLVLLVNEGSASASEIVAGAMRDHRGITIVGATTFGKGSVQEFKDLPADTSLKLTIARWLTPLGAHINEVGITPTIEVETNIEELRNDIDKQLEKAIEVIESL